MSNKFEGYGKDEPVTADSSSVLDMKIIEDAAIASAKNHGTPDISGGYEEEDGVLYFKDGNGRTTLIMNKEAFELMLRENKWDIIKKW